MGIDDRQEGGVPRGEPPAQDAGAPVSVHLDFTPEMTELNRGSVDEDSAHDTPSEMSFSVEFESADGPFGSREAPARAPDDEPPRHDVEAIPDATLLQFVEHNPDFPEARIDDLWTLLQWLARLVQSQLAVAERTPASLLLEPRLRGNKYRLRTAFGYLEHSGRFSLELRFTAFGLCGIALTFGFTADRGLEDDFVPHGTSSYRVVAALDGHVHTLQFECTTQKSEYGAEVLAEPNLDDLSRFVRGAVLLAVRRGLR